MCGDNRSPGRDSSRRAVGRVGWCETLKGRYDPIFETDTFSSRHHSRCRPSIGRPICGLPLKPRQGPNSRICAGQQGFHYIWYILWIVSRGVPNLKRLLEESPRAGFAGGAEACESAGIADPAPPWRLTGFSERRRHALTCGPRRSGRRETRPAQGGNRPSHGPDDRAGLMGIATP